MQLDAIQVIIIHFRNTSVAHRAPCSNSIRSAKMSPPLPQPSTSGCHRNFINNGPNSVLWKIVAMAWLKGKHRTIWQQLMLLSGKGSVNRARLRIAYCPWLCPCVRASLCVLFHCYYKYAFLLNHYKLVSSIIVFARHCWPFGLFIFFIALEIMG